MAPVKKAVPADQPETRAGTHLSSEYEEALATEVEAGFDPASLSADGRAGLPWREALATPAG